MIKEEKDDENLDNLIDIEDAFSKEEVERIKRSMDDFENGRYRDYKEVFADIRKHIDNIYKDRRQG